MNLIDNTFGIKKQALAVMSALSSLDMIDLDSRSDSPARAQTFPWYNGRECGVCLLVSRHLVDGNALFVAFGEHRNTDEIFVDVWAGGRPFNAPTADDFTDEVYARRRTFPYLRVDLAAQYIQDRISTYLNGSE